jgi:hypothetical protein
MLLPTICLRKQVSSQDKNGKNEHKKLLLHDVELRKQNYMIFNEFMM